MSVGVRLGSVRSECRQILLSASFPRVCAFVVALSALSTLAGASSAAPTRVPQVLILVSNDITPAEQIILQTIREVLATAAPLVRVNAYFLATANFASEAHDRLLAEALAERFREDPVDVLVSLATLSFVRDHGDQVWPAAKRVLVWFDGRLREQDRSAAAEIVTPPLDYAGTVQAFLGLFPDTTRVLLLAGASEVDDGYLREAERALGPLAPRVTIDRIAKTRLADTLEQVKRLPEGTLVLPVMFIEDLDGHKARPVEFAAQVAAASNRPVIGVHGTWIGRGVVGGHVVDYSAVGRAVATAIRGVLDGALAGATPDADSTEWQFDARQLARWRIDERDLPPGSRVLYREPSAWERYRVQIVILAAGIGLQTLIIAGLVVERRARRKAMAALRDEEARRQRAEFHARVQLHEQSHVRTMAAMGQMAATMAHEMNQPLAAALGNAQALRRMIERAGLRDQDIIDTLTDVISQNKRAGDVVQRIRTLARKGSVEFGPVDLDQLADEVAGLVTVEAKHAGVPIVVHRSPQGAVAHGDRVQLLQVLLNVVQNAIQAGNGYAGARVSLMVEVDESADRVSVTVADSGPGIAPDLLPRLFEPFFTTKPDGLGLGLAICRAIVDLHGGDIRVRNLASSGAEIAVRLPRHSGGPA